MALTLQNTVVLVTGASSGLGAGTAEYFAERGARVILADISDAGQATAERFSDHAIFCSTDVTSEASVNQTLDVAEQRFGTPRVVVSCAGVLGGGRVVGRDGPHALDAFRRVIEVNLIGTFNVARLAAARMIDAPPVDDEGQRGVLIHTASVAAEEGQIGQAAYSASKGGVAAMTLPMARELAKFGVRVVAIAPGVFETPMMQATPDALRESLAAQIPFPSRFGKPAEFAGLAQHIVENSMLNGCLLRIDGAIRMQAR